MSTPLLTLVLLLAAGILLLVHGQFGTHTEDSFLKFSAAFKSGSGLPDFAQYKYLEVIENKRLRIEDASRRVIFVGDIHGMSESLHALLSKLHYSPKTDLLIHTGDVITRGKDSLAILDFLASNNISGVRGNNDQKVIEWRSWIEWVLSHRGGREWLENMEKHAHKGLAEIRAERCWNGVMRKKWMQIPKGWKFMGDHYRVAREMSDEHYTYLLRLPLVLHLPTTHTFVVHAGILPHDPRYSAKSVHQPLAHVPKDVEVDPPEPTLRPHFAVSPPQGDQIPLVTKDDGSAAATSEEALTRKLKHLRKAQELSMLAEVPQNADPWVVLNMRSVTDDDEVTRSSDEGTPWAELWNSDMKRCGGYDPGKLAEFDGSEEYSSAKTNAKHLPCYPSTIVYGHSASRDLDIQRWTKGLDTGCVYGRRLTALVVSSSGSDDALDESAEATRTKFGEDDDFEAKLVSVSCKGP